ncbi:MAG: flagellar hook-basal body complex protein FliE [bacterium]
MKQISLIDLKPVLFNQPSPPASSPKSEDVPSFSETIKEAIQRVDDLQSTADQNLQDFITHKNKDLHDVMISWEKADTSLKLLMQVRSKVLDAYQEVMRMPV